MSLSTLLIARCLSLCTHHLNKTTQGILVQGRTPEGARIKTGQHNSSSTVVVVNGINLFVVTCLGDLIWESFSARSERRVYLGNYLFRIYSKKE
jgi:hypothetical protein